MFVFVTFQYYPLIFLKKDKKIPFKWTIKLIIIIVLRTLKYLLIRKWTLEKCLEETLIDMHKGRHNNEPQNSTTWKIWRDKCRI